MCRGKTITAIALAVLMAVGPAVAQSPPRLLLQIQPQMQMQPRIQRQPRLQQQQRMRQPRLLIIPPSRAAQIAKQMNPGAQLLKIQPRGNGYIATMRQGNQVFRVPVPGN